MSDIVERLATARNMMELERAAADAIDEIFQRDNFTCQYCGAKPPDAVLHIDHVVPIAKGGTNRPHNLVTACQACNLGKRNCELYALPPIMEWSDQS